jgi:hypothetical protein
MSKLAKVAAGVGAPPAAVFLLNVLNFRLPLYAYWDPNLMYPISVAVSLGGALLGYLWRPRTKTRRGTRFAVFLALLVACALLYDYLLRTPATLTDTKIYVLGLYVGFVGTYLMSGFCLGDVTDFLFTSPARSLKRHHSRQAHAYGHALSNTMQPFHVGDIIAIRDRDFFSRAILKATDNTVSHVGMVIAADPGLTLVIEALWRVKTRPLQLSIDDAESAYILSDHSLGADERNKLVSYACTFSADGYGWWAIGWQAADAIFHTTFFTDHFSWKLNHHPICSYLVAKAYQELRLTFGRERLQSITPANIFNFASSHPEIYSVMQIK